MIRSSRLVVAVARVTALALVALSFCQGVSAAEPPRSRAKDILARVGGGKVLCAVLGLEEAGRPGRVIELARAGENLVYFQSPAADELNAVRRAAEEAGLLGQRVFVGEGDYSGIHLASNLADLAVVGARARESVKETELTRILRPGGKALLGGQEITKAPHEGTDSWSHPYHGPDNNPQSTDQLARAPYLTQFLAEPKFCPMPEVSVAAGGRIYRAFGHIAHKANQNPMLNKLLGINAYNGLILWQRDLSEGFMIHRNTLIATPGALYLGDHESCKVIDADSGRVKREIVIPEGVADGPVWKWMALEDGVLHALVGGRESRIHTQPSEVAGLGHWPWGMWEGHDYSDPETNFGFGRTFVALDPSTGKILWKHQEDEYLDSRGICMKNGRIYFYCPEKFLACLDTEKREVVWRTDDRDLLEAIGPNSRAQHYVTGYATTTYIKCNDKYIFFAGPQRERLVVASAGDGKLLWQKEHGNLQLVLRDDGFYAAGPRGTGAKLDYSSGEVLAQLPHRRACTRATGTLDSIFYRTPGGTVRIVTADNTARHIAPMRPPCQDGVIISDGHLYWGPWMCGCQLSLYGHICLGPASEYFSRATLSESRLETAGESPDVEALNGKPGDWPTYLGRNSRAPFTRVEIPRQVKKAWTCDLSRNSHPTAPVLVDGLAFVGDRTGVVRAIDGSGTEKWKTYTGGAVYFPPAVDHNRAFVGSADGWVYALEAATGRRLWRYRVGPGERRLPVYGKLISTWPVSGGVVARDGVVYAAAGIAHYDGTYVVALDALTGTEKWRNETSGTLSEKVQSGISLQGPLYLRGGELQFLGGGVYHTARYDLGTGKCLNEPHEDVNSRFQTAFYAYFPEYGTYLSHSSTFDDGTTLTYAASYEGSQHTSLSLLAPPDPDSPEEAAAPQRRTDRPQRRPQRKALWEIPGHRYSCLVVAPGVVLAAAQTGEGDAHKAFLAAIELKTGEEIWREALPAPAVKGGLGVDHEGRMVVSLRNGQVVCYAPGS